MLENTLSMKVQAQSNNHSYRYQSATDLFKFALLKGQILRFVKRLLRRRQWLVDLAAFKPQAKMQSSFYAGPRVVEISKIVGTEGRATDFDSDFYPISERSRERWTNVALAYSACCTPLPPVELTQVGNMYFVRDGHHRISVARALGQTAVDAEVTVWKAQMPSYLSQKSLQSLPIHFVD